MAKPGFDTAPASWGPPPLTARPEGLLSSLGIQSGGKYPQHLSPELIPTYELGPWYREYNGTFRSVGPVTSATTQSGSTWLLWEVPDGEVWIVSRLTAWCTKVVNNQMSVNLYRTNNANGTKLLLGNKAITTTGVATNMMIDGGDHLPIILRPTVRVWAEIEWVTGTTGAVALDMYASMAVLIAKI